MVLATFGEWHKVSKAVCIDGFTLQHLKHRRETDLKHKGCGQTVGKLDLNQIPKFHL